MWQYLYGYLLAFIHVNINAVGLLLDLYYVHGYKISVSKVNGVGLREFLVMCRFLILLKH